MKKLLYILLVIAASTASAQEFDKNLTTARSSYGSGDLENARFAMEQMLRDLDMAIGKEILKLLPTQIGSLKTDEKKDNLTGGSGYGGGLYVQRHYGVDPKSGQIEIINNSPLINSIQAILTTPILGGMMRDENQKQVKIQGYKSLLTKTVNSETAKTNYELQIPMNNTLVTVRMEDSNEAEIVAAANGIQLAKIVAIAQ
ncbi:MAG TPA: hypothetical protein VK508_10200 [Cyclobacteriaceae bacterium]|nr:hypothetical protein [Cyclobacteriaceae bacterium]